MVDISVLKEKTVEYIITTAVLTYIIIICLCDKYVCIMHKHLCFLFGPIDKET